MEHLFEPFFTTKEKGKGTGLGLTTVQEVVKQWGGVVWACSSPGEGAVFTVGLPRAQCPPGMGEILVSPGAAAVGNETVLLVEDEDGVRRLLMHVLTKRGYNVVEAPDAEEALRIFQQRPEDIHLVLTDMVMPKMSGRELGEHLSRIRPETKVIYMSGYTDDVLVRTGALGPGMAFLQKPLRPDILAAKVRETLDSPSRQFDPR
jgi:CheY-like chemotaxis protein